MRNRFGRKHQSKMTGGNVFALYSPSHPQHKHPMAFGAPDIYFSNTPLTTLIACALAHQPREAEATAVLFIYEAFAEVETYRRAVQDWPESPFAEVIVLKGEYSKNEEGVAARGPGVKNSQVRHHFHAQNLRLIDDVFSRYQPRRILTNNDRSVSTQYAFQRARKQAPQLRIVYFDDGIGSYVEGLKGKRPVSDWIDTWRRRFIYGRWYHYDRRMGGTKWTDEARVAWPEHYLARDRFAPEDLRPLDPAMFLNPGYCALPRALCRHFEIEADQFEDCRLFILLPHSKTVHRIPGYLEGLQHFLTECERNDYRVALKYHPREVEDFLQLSERRNTAQVPAAAPFEIILSLLPNDHSIAITTTACSVLATTRFLRPQAKAICLDLVNSEKLQPFYDFFAQLGIPTVQTLEALRERLD